MAKPWRIGNKTVIATVVAGLMMVTTVAVGSSGHDDRSSYVRRSVDSHQAKNVILFIGDGMGDSEITIARNYEVGAAGRLAMDGLPFTGEYTTYSVEKGTTDLPVYVTDSAASGTGWATGHKTYNNAISVDPVTLDPMTTILELAQKAGYKVGNVTTADLTDATPAVLDAHVSLRGCQGPANMASCPGEAKEDGGLGSIAEQTVDHGVDVLMGGGLARFEQVITGGPDVGKTVLESAQNAGYVVATDSVGLEAADSRKPLLGLFSSSHMDLEWTGPLATPYPGPTATACTESNPTRPSSEPHLSEMTAKAIELLSARTKGRHSSPGFFLQVEGASIDKQDHASNPCGQIGETVEFDNAVEVALQWAKKHPDTLIVITADHGHTSQIIEAQSTTDHSPGSIATLITADNQPMVVGYATNLPGRSQSHTGTQVRIAAQGPKAANVSGVIDQTDLFYMLKQALGIH